MIIREDLTEENAKLKVLLAANFGRTKNDPVKQRKVAVEYVNLCGFKGSGNPNQLVHNGLISLKDIAKQLNLSETSLKKLLLIERKLTPEVKQLLDNGLFTKTTASELLVKLSPEEQEELISTLDITKKYTQKQIQEYVDKLKEKENEIEELKSQPKEKEVIEKFIDEKVKIENEKLKREKQQLENSKSTLENILKTTESLKEKYKKDSEEYIKVRDKMVKIGYTSGCDIDIINASKSICELSEKIENYLQTELAPMKYKDFMFLLAENDILKQNFMNLLNCVYDWYLDMKNCIDLDGINIDENIIDMEVL